MPVALAATLVLAFTIILRMNTPAKSVRAEVTVQNVSRQLEDRAAAAAPAPAPEVRAAAPAAAQVQTERAASNNAVVVDLAAASAPDAPADALESERAVNDVRARRLEKVADAARPAPMGASTSRTAGASYANDGVVSNEERVDATTSGELRASAPKPAWRRDSKSWLAEIERLRAAGDNARADAELAEYKREHRAYAGAPDR
jgi:hypothetical protein